MRKPKKFRKVKNKNSVKACKSYFRMFVVSGGGLVITDFFTCKGVPHIDHLEWVVKTISRDPFVREMNRNRKYLKDMGVGYDNGSAATFPRTEKNLAFARYLVKTKDISQYSEIINR